MVDRIRWHAGGSCFAASSFLLIECHGDDSEQNLVGQALRFHGNQFFAGSGAE
jgi:hypothetical protein